MFSVFNFSPLRERDVLGKCRSDGQDGGKQSEDHIIEKEVEMPNALATLDTGTLSLIHFRFYNLLEPLGPTAGEGADAIDFAL